MFIDLIIFITGEAIRCYECNSHNDTRCADAKPPAELEIDCGTHKKGTEYTFCRKIVQIIEFSVNNCKYFGILIVVPEIN